MKGICFNKDNFLCWQKFFQFEKVKFGYSENATKFEKKFHLKFDAKKSQISRERFFQIFGSSQNIRTLTVNNYESN